MTDHRRDAQSRIRLKMRAPEVEWTMQSQEKLKDLRDALWQATIETKARFGETTGDPYSQPLDEVAAHLGATGAISDHDAGLIIAFLQKYDPGDQDLVSVEIPDNVDTELSRIIAQLRSVRLPEN
jgi:hypothetical protein